MVGDAIIDHSFKVTGDWSGPASTAAHTAITKIGNGTKVGCDVAVSAADVIRTYERALTDAKTAYDNARLQIDALRRDFLTDIDTADPEDAATSRELFRRHSAGHLDAMSDAIRGLTSASTAAAAQIDALIAQLDGMSPTAQPGHGNSGLDHFLNEAGNQLDGFIDGVVGGVKEPIGFVGGLIGLNGDVSDNWANFGNGLVHNVTHPLDFAKNVIGYDDLANGDYGHWLGNLVPGAVAAIATGGGALAIRGTTGAARRPGGASPDAGTPSKPSAHPQPFAAPVPGGGPVAYNAVVRPGPLADPDGGYVGRQAGNFRNGSYVGVVTDSEILVHRFYGGGARPDGGYWTPGMPQGPLQGQLGNAIVPDWGNTMDHVVTRVIPPGTTIYSGPAAPQPVTFTIPSPDGDPRARRQVDSGGELMGGDTQIFIPTLPPEWSFP
ncbi:hypothetical protein [Kineococcus xinjiangensis]|uniref:hypothetical protein n=1 Tax=Kineococcus xinjiangensis TaxID=512762 RepID=UPI000CEBF982|nr:hypothetical protein [Kineococcus xinjiangensis]